MSSDLFSKRLILVLGKGGVGRTSVAAALAQRLAARGRKTLLYQANAKETLSRLLGARPISDVITPVAANLWAVNTSPSAALHEYALMILRFETVYRVVLENRMAKSLLRAIPGLDEYAIMGKLWYHTTEMLSGQRPKWDTVVFDAPATGHALNMLRIPRSILEVVPKGPLTRDALKVRELLEDPARTAAVLVTLPEDMPANEAIDAHHVLTRELEITVSHLIVNRLYPDRFGYGTAAARVLAEAPEASQALGGSQAGGELGVLLASGRMMARRRALHDKYLERLSEQLDLPQLHVPFLFTSTFGADEVAKIGGILVAQLKDADAGKSALK